MQKLQSVACLTLLLTSANCVPLVCNAQSAVGPKPREGVFKVEYHSFTLLATEDSIIALHIIPDPRYGGENGITYRWFRVPGNDVSLFCRKPERSTSRDVTKSTVKPFLDVTTGCGETNSIKTAMGYIVIGSMLIEWSSASENAGYLYLVNEKQISHKYEKQFDRLDELNVQLDNGLWKETHSNTTLNGRH